MSIGWLNTWCGVGRIVFDPTLKTYKKEGETHKSVYFKLYIPQFTRALGESKVPIKVKDPYMVSLMAFGKTAENICKYCSKGAMIGVRGALNETEIVTETNYYKSMIVLVEQVQFVDKKNKNKRSIKK